jgi:flagellar FliL protein
MAEKTEEVAPEKKKSKLILIIGGALVLALVGGGGLFALKYFKKSDPAKTAKHSSASEKDKDKKGKEEILSTLNLESFLVNLADKDESRYVKASFKLGLGGEKEAEELGKNSVFLAATRDAIISILTSKTSEELLTAEGKDALRKEILTKVNVLMAKGKVQEVYIVDFVVQL